MADESETKRWFAGLIAPLARRSDDLPAVPTLPNALVESVPKNQQSEVRSLVRRLLLEPVRVHAHELDVAEFERSIRRLNLAADVHDAFVRFARSYAAAQPQALAESIADEAKVKQQDAAYRDSVHKTRMREEELRRKRLDREDEELSRPTAGVVSEPEMEQTFRERLMDALAPLADLAAAQAEVYRIALQAQQEAKERGELPSEQERVFRKIKNVGASIIEDIARGRGPNDDRK